MECKNCKYTLDNTANFCSNCGAKIIKNRLTIKGLLNDINSIYFSANNKLLKTFGGLFTKPENIINSYINGIRKKHLDVLQYFAVALTLVGLQLFLMNTFFAESLEASFNSIKTLDIKNIKPDNRFLSFADINKYQNIIYIITIPIYALTTWLINLIINHTKRYNLAEHFVINLYYNSQAIIITAVLSILFLIFGLDYFTISGGITILIFLYFYYVLKKVFTLSTLYTFAYGTLSLILIFGFSIFLSVVVFGSVAFFS